MSAKKKGGSAGQRLRKLLLDIFRQHPHKAYNYKQVIRKLHQEPFFEEAADLVLPELEDWLKTETLRFLEEMSFSGEIEETERGKYRLFPEEHFVIGRIDITASGNAFVMNDDFEEDIYVARNDTRNALSGDTVKLSLFARKPGKRAEGEVVEVVERARKEYTGIIQLSNRFAFLAAAPGSGGVDIFIPLQSLKGAEHGQKAVARIVEWPEDSRNPTGEIIRILGYPGDNNAEMDAILVEYGFPLEFPAEVEREAEQIPENITVSEIRKRKDFRNILTFTIDPVDAKDFDDAISFRTLENGNFEVGIHIADVSHYVKPGTELEEEALRRATSVYLVDRVIPMLPEKLSNKVCSLRPGEDKLCYAAVFEMNAKAEVLSEWFGRTVIHSDRRFSYEEAQQVIEEKKGDLAIELQTLNQMARLMRKERFRKGAIGFEKVEVKFRLNDKGHPVDVYLKESKDSNKLIEEFMLLANRSVAEYVGKKLSIERGKEQPFVYRVHDTPVEKRLAGFTSFATRFGYTLNTRNDREIAHSLNRLMNEIKGKKEQNVLEQLAIRSMAKAIYTTDNIGHYGLAFDFYTHFTSPIRRYPDVMVHRLLDHYMRDGKPRDAEELEKNCSHSTDMEIRASEAERASVKYKQVQYMLDRKGQVFDGIISGVTEWGIYVELTESKCEGLIRIRDLDDDFYELNEEEYCLVGRRTRKKYQLGDPVQVILKNGDLLRKQIDFVLAGTLPAFSGNSRERRTSRANSSRKSGPRGKGKKSGGRGRK